MAMTKYLSRHGNSLALVIERSVLELLGFDKDTPLRITTDGRVIRISKARGSSRKEVLRRAVRKSLRRYGPMYKRLADE